MRPCLGDVWPVLLGGGRGFLADPMAGEETPDRAVAEDDAVTAPGLAKFLQGQLRDRVDKRRDPMPVLLDDL